MIGSKILDSFIVLTINVNYQSRIRMYLFPFKEMMSSVLQKKKAIFLRLLLSHIFCRIWTLKVCRGNFFHHFATMKIITVECWYGTNLRQVLYLSRINYTHAHSFLLQAVLLRPLYALFYNTFIIHKADMNATIFVFFAYIQNCAVKF